MKIISSFKIITVLTFSVTLTPFLLAHEGHDHDKTGRDDTPATILKADASGVSDEWLAKAKAEYPLETRVVSGDKFDGGDMGKPQDYVYKQKDSPDRLVRFCCKDCIRDFKKEPAKFLKALDDAAAEKSKPVTSK